MNEKHPFISKYNSYMGSFAYYIKRLEEQAIRDNAPQNATWYDERKERWHTTDDITNPQTRKALGLE